MERIRIEWAANSFKDLLYTPSRYKIYYGGRGGGKSHAFAEALILRSVKEKIRILCTREYQNSIADSVHRLLEDKINKLGLLDMFNITKTSIISESGSEFLFKGLARSIQEIKSTEGIDVCWLEEGQNTAARSLEILIPTIREPNSEIWISFNPENETDPVYQQFIANPPPDAVVHRVNWSDNVFFPEVLNRERLYMLSVDPEAYQHVWEGFCRQISDAQILKGKYEVADFNDPPPGTIILYGADFGFSQDPSTLIRMWEFDRCLYISHEAYGIGVELDDMPAFYKQVPGSDTWPIKGDNARPETISHIKRRGFDISAAKKWAGSVEDGLTYLRSYRKIYIHARCKHTAEEARLYSYKVDKQTEEVTPIVVDAHNHCIDAIRYALDTRISKHNFMDNCQFDVDPGMQRRVM